MGVEISLDEKMGVGSDGGELHNLTAPYELVKDHARLDPGAGTDGPRVSERHACRCRADVPLPGPVWICTSGVAGDGCADRDRTGLYSMPVPPAEAARIVMDLVTVTGTENLMMAATLADGTQ